MTSRKSEEDTFFDGVGEEKGVATRGSIWSPPFDDLDSGNCTASVDSMSSRSLSQCASSQVKVHQQQLDSKHKGHSQIIPPKSVMTVKAPPKSENAYDSNGRPITYIVHPSQSQSPSPVSSKPSLIPLNLLSGGDASGSRDESCEYLRSILVNFNSLYMEKLKMIDDLVDEGSEDQKKLLMEKKTNMLESWAKDVCVHNMVLVHTVEELEREANRKVAALQKKMIEAAQLAKEHMNTIKKYEEQVKLLLKNHGDTEERNLVLKIELEKLKSECRRVRDRMNSLLKDNDSLLTLVCRIRDMGAWDISGLELQRTSFDQIFGLYPNLAGGEVQTVFTRERARQVKETETKVAQLEEQLRALLTNQHCAESFIVQKDKKIQELEQEIKNVLNKANYCENECNDYKRSLLETQEKLLEATRRLAQSSSQYVKHKASGTQEMAELYQELREVKSQLNTAVDEKNSAKDESDYFKNQLSERLKEMHEIQSVFQSLATEVVSSRAAFQQVHEKETQLQTLKSEVQTYQTRCSEAENTILKKENEILRLQNQMEEIKKKKEATSQATQASQASIYVKPPDIDKIETPRLTPRPRFNVPSNAPPPKVQSKSPAASPRRFLTPHRIPPMFYKDPPNQIRGNAKHTLNKNMGGNVQLNRWNRAGGRPPWNVHHKKIDILSRPPPAIPPVNKANRPSRSQSSLIRSTIVKQGEALDHIGHNCKDIYDRLTDLERQMSPSERNVRRSLSNPTLPSARSGSARSGSAGEEKVKLPKILPQENKYTQKPSVQSTPMPEEEKLPNIHFAKPGLTFVKHHVSATPDPQAPNNRTPTPRLKELITAVVETSRQLIEEQVQNRSKKSDKKKSMRPKSVTVTATHYHRKKPKESQTDSGRTKSSGLTPDRNHNGGGDNRRNKPASKGRSSTAPSPRVQSQNKKKTFQPPENVKEYLSELPEDSFEDIVKTWIRKSSSHSITEDVKKPKATKSMPVSGRQGSLRVMKHLATRRCPPTAATAASTHSNENSQMTDELEQEMFEIEREWGMVFSNLESNKNKSIPATPNTPLSPGADDEGSPDTPNSPVDDPPIGTERLTIRPLYALRQFRALLKPA